MESLNNMMKQWEEEYNKCFWQKDFEEYFIKYRDTENPYVEKAKFEIKVRNSISMPVRIAVFSLCAAIVSGIVILCMGLDGTTNEFLGFLGFCSMILGFAVVVFGIGVLVYPKWLYNLIKTLKGI